jgi:hypothetical protein
MKEIDFYFDFSPYSHFALAQLRQWPVRLRYRPFEIIETMRLVGRRLRRANYVRR